LWLGLGARARAIGMGLGLSSAEKRSWPRCARTPVAQSGAAAAGTKEVLAMAERAHLVWGWRQGSGSGWGWGSGSG